MASDLTYTPLAEGCIRLLRLLPLDEQNSGLSGLLETYELSSAPRFTALSYEWGPHDANLTVLRLETGVAGLRKNAATALTALRDHHSVDIVWVDSVCINQSNLVERAQQVRLMGRIYSSAAEVLIWLGDEDGLSELAFDSATKLARLSDLDDSRQTRNFDQARVQAGCELARAERTARTGPDVNPVNQIAHDNSFLTADVRAAFYRNEEVSCSPMTRFLAGQRSPHARREAGNMITLLGSLDLPFNTAFIAKRLRRDPLRSPAEVPARRRLIPWDSSFLPERVRAVLKEIDITAPLDLVWEALCSVFGRSWFYRAWTLQELVLARLPIVVVGRLAMSWDILLYSDDILWRFGIFGNRFGRASDRAFQMNLMRETFREHKEIDARADQTSAENGEVGQSIPFDEVLTMIRDCDCAEPRDKVFAVLGITGPFYSKAFPVDYDVPLASLYAAATRHNINKSGRLDVLRFVYPRLSTDLPSWVADLRRMTVGSDLFLRAQQNGMDASGGRAASTAVDYGTTNPLQLKLRGHRVATITDASVKLQLFQAEDVAYRRLSKPVTNISWVRRELESILLVLNTWRAFCAAKSSDPYPAYVPPGAEKGRPDRDIDDRSLITVFWKTVCAEIWMGRGTFSGAHVFDAQKSVMFEQTDDPRLACIPDTTLFGLFYMLNRSLDDDQVPDWHGTGSFWKYAGGLSAQKRFFVLEGRFVGTGPIDLEPGDEVWVLEGGAMPFILREVEAGKQENGTSDMKVRRMVGPAYVYGIMRGEAWPEDDSTRAEVILI